MKRYHPIVAKPGEIKAAYGKEDNRRNSPKDIWYVWGEGAYSGDVHLIMGVFEELDIFPQSKSTDKQTLRKELERRGYDITTFKFSIQKLKGDNKNG
jgi:hypothetical protein